MLPNILPLIPPHEVYTEVFFGGGSVFWSKPKATNETINDILDIVVNFYQQVKTNFPKLKKLIDSTCFSRSLHNKALFMIKNKKMFDDIQLAWAFWMCSNFSYGNKIGGGLKYSNDQSVLPPRIMKNMKQNFTDRLVERIEHVHIENKDAIEVLESRNVSKAFHYIDSPYPNADQGHYKGYTFDHLKQLLLQCEKLKGKFLLSNYNSEMLSEFVANNNWWKKEYLVNTRGMRKHDLNKVEVLVANYVPAVNLELNFSESHADQL